VNHMPPGLNTDPVSNRTWAADLSDHQAQHGPLDKEGLILSGEDELAGGTNTWMEWHPVFRAPKADIDQHDDNPVDLSGAALAPPASGEDANLTHPFGYDREFFLAPDNPKYLQLFAHENYGTIGGTNRPDLDHPKENTAGVLDPDYAQAIKNA